MTDELEYERKIAQQSRRSASNEAGLVWSLSAVGVGLLVFFLLFKVPTIPIPLNLRIHTFSISCGVIFGGVIALLHFRRVKAISKRAAKENLAIMQGKQARQKSELDQKIAAMKAREVEQRL